MILVQDLLSTLKGINNDIPGTFMITVLFAGVKLSTHSLEQEISLQIGLLPVEILHEGFSVIEHLRFICSGDSLDGLERYVKNDYL